MPADAGVVDSRVERYKEGLLRERPDFSLLPDAAREDRLGAWKRATEDKVVKYRRWLEEGAR